MSPFEPYPPEDFDAFWTEGMAEAMSAPLDFHRSNRSDFDLPGFVVETIGFRGFDGRALEGWLAFPEGARRLPSFVWLPPYGRESLLPNEYGTREGMTSFSFNFHGLGAFHQERYSPARGYFAEKMGDPETWVFRAMLLNAAVASRILMAQVEADEDRIGAMGMSQGAGLSIWLGAWCPLIKAICADMPFLGAMRFALNRNVHRYPLKEIVDFMENEPLGPEKVWHTLSYFDTLNQATRCAKPTLISQGLKDPAVRPEAVQAIYEALPGVKKLVTYDWGHDWHPEMVDNDRNWMLEHL